MQRSLLLVYIGAALCVFAADLPAWSQGALGLALLSHGYRQWRLHARLDRADSVIGIEYHGDRGWGVLCRDGAVHEMRLGSSSFAHPLLSVLVFTGAPAKSRTVVLLPDMSDAASLRRLRVLLRTGVLPH